MRIEGYNQINSIYKTGQVKKIEAPVKTGATDQVQISQAGRDYQIAKKAVAETPDVREELVDSVKAKIDAGTYKVNADDFASKVIEKYKKNML
ncbi:flagellar biosynthesis anti-sigma factor FlgM [Anaerobium acetethylicum]|uniref:Negative regulator of flagellin synthesis n=1 Tax=Anaerobium acetethylicum TaxID=1619234 RepID=A0A1D3TUP5_9FIRM|nr:flagellar biosynthesis anti-sigma factor FlgM [Anaerobium acetethylicum]SCP97805.1 negative regulator of flagellin synthesis FlgM [Anaerobium acetethylicum]